MASDKVTRRDFIRLSAAAAAGGLMASCATPTAAPATQEAAKEATVAPTATAVQPTPEPTAASSEYTGSPVHGDLVKAGKLPPVEDRIPQNPLIWNEYDVLAFEKEKGRYGGTVVIGNSGGLSGMSLLGLARYMADDTMKFVADIAESWEMTPDAKTVTFHMRKGHKWSDGQPLTAQDWQWYNDEIIHSKYLAAPMGLAGIETLTDKIVAVDDFTLRFEFGKPNPLFLQLARGVAGGEAGHWTQCPPHFMEQFHPDYNSMSEYANAEEQFDKEIVDRLNYLAAVREPGRPVLWGWVPLEYAEAQFAGTEKNPYFHCVDRWGQQMPYLDRYDNLLLESGDKEVILLKLCAGETHWERRLGSVTEVPFLTECGEDHLDFIYTIKPEGAQQGIYFSGHDPDPNWSEILEQADFRRALSIAVDRETINQTAYFGLGKIGHGFSLPGVFDPEIDGKWVEYDLGKASEMLDDLGLTNRDDEGFRTFPNGEKMTFVLGMAPGWHPGNQESGEIAAEGWNAIGVRTVTTVHGPGDMINEWSEGKSQAYVRSSIGGDVMFDLKHSTGLRWGAPEFRWWQTKDLEESKRQGVEPPDDLKHFLELGDKVMTVIDDAEREQLLDERRRFMADSCWYIGMVQTVPHVLVVDKKLRGVWGRTDEIQWKLGAGDEEFWPRSWFWAE